VPHLSGPVVAGIVLFALAPDLVFGDPPSRWHPVAWIGRAIGAGQRRLARGSPSRLLVSGALAMVVTALAAGAGGS
jgi:adenosylcobinamide-phosphate synthase